MENLREKLKSFTKEDYVNNLVNLHIHTNLSDGEGNCKQILASAKEKNYKYEKFLKEYGLPEDLPKNTSERAMFYNIPVKKYVEKTPGNESFEALKESMGWDDSVTEDMTIGDALDITKLSYYVGEEQLERFKALYELPDEVTGDTLYGEVRNVVDAKEKEFREAEALATPTPTAEVQE